MAEDTALDIAQTHLREALASANRLVGEAQDSLDRAKIHLALSQKAMNDFLKLKYPKETR